MKTVEQVPEYIRTLIPYEPGKPIEEVEREYGIANSIKLASNENPLGPSPKALAAIREKLDQLHLYPDGDCFYLKRGMAQKIGVEAENLIFGNGSNEIIELAVRTFMRPGDEAVMAEQAFVVYPLIVQAVGGKKKAVPLRNFTHDLAAIADAITAKTRVVFLANPNNPTGTIYQRDEWERLLGKMSSNLLLIVDEAYFEYVQDPAYPDSLRYHAEDRAILTLRTFSKLYGLAGLRIGYGVGPKKLIDMMQRVRQPFNVNAAAQWAALAALEDVDHVRRSVEVNRLGMEYLQAEFTRLGLEFVPSDANFILVRVGKGQEVFKQLLSKGVIVRPMAGYQFPEHVRVTIGTMDENRKFIDALQKVIRAL
ncbi:MAG TPA: histidinol-phosphate transaminase [Candidatus Binatia bacterium]|jgi:histidinol-phosphate aminotransferase|nr:histidinol-phosphate transaminase [Candidatus Binatia bacterium]